MGKKLPWEDPDWDIFEEEKKLPCEDPDWDPIFDEEDDHDCDEDDGDALASAGFGTDEDYGG